MTEQSGANKSGLERAERFKKALDYLTYRGLIRDVRELSQKKIIAYTNVSKAKNGDLKYLTANMFERLCKEYGVFNLDFLLHGEGEMLREGSGSMASANSAGGNNVSIRGDGNSNVTGAGDISINSGSTGRGGGHNPCAALENQLAEKDRQIEKLLDIIGKNLERGA